MTQPARELPGVQRVGHEVGVVHLVGAEVDGGLEQGVHAGLRALGKGDQGEALEIDVGAGARYSSEATTSFGRF